MKPRWNTVQGPLATTNVASWLILSACLVAGAPTCFAQSSPTMDRLREEMARVAIIGQGITNDRVIQAMRDTPRHEFIPVPRRKLAYFDMAVPIGYRQTISSPFIVAFMTEALEPRASDRVLEIGTGSGYQAAVLSPLVRDVYSIEIVQPLGERAIQTLKRLQYKNVHVKIGDGFQGWLEYAPFDKIVVTCSPESVPDALVQQLREEGRLVIPVGERYQQTLHVFRKENGKLVTEALRPTLFVPMTGKAEETRNVQPDPIRPKVVNGDFEKPLLENGMLPGWYYQRHLRRLSDDTPQGKHYAVFQNDIPGRASYALQGFGIDGRKVRRIKLSSWIKTENVIPGPEKDMVPYVVVAFYDHDRREVGRRWLGPWRGTVDWREVSQVVRVPGAAREAILRIGLFGATGEFCIDCVQLAPNSSAVSGR